ncbi:ferritin, heavy subunit-like isoform X1 [Osmia lignaria lignaria]|uniref:ferritin, heavy subunit-like isoform X1 n=2 Tax=Osmia lignaria lignaria TaxID=1437193 RepID=UPI00402BEEA3
MLRSFYCRIILGNISHPRFRQLYNTKTCKSQYSLHWHKFDKQKCRLLSSSTGKTSEQFCIDKPMKWPSGKPANYKFHEDTENVLNEQINSELKAFYYYLSMAAYFGRADVALPGCESFFIQMHHEEHEHALRFLNYVQMRGGRVHLCPVLPPTDQDWKCPLHAFKKALELEIEVTEKLVAVNTVAEKHGDLNASDFIVTGFMEDQMKSVNEMGRFVAVLSGIGDQALARFMFDKDLLDSHVVPKFNVIRTKFHTNKTSSTSVSM